MALGTVVGTCSLTMLSSVWVDEYAAVISLGCTV